MLLKIGLKFGNGDFQYGFDKNTLTVSVVDSQNPILLETQLTSSPEIPVLYQKWKDEYINLADILGARVKIKKITKFSWSERYQDYEKITQELLNNLNEWLDNIKIQLESLIETELNYDSEIIFTIYTQNIKSTYIKDILHRLPWQEWDYFTDCDALEAVLYLHETESNTSSVVQSVVDSGIFRRVRITSIFGDVENIKEGVERDKEEIEKLEKRGAELIHLEQPQRPDLKKLWDEPCDILFYSGHSNSEENSTAGRFKINKNDNLSLEEITNTLREAIKKVLKIAIFNSCDGLGLACELAKLNLPYIIVWREPVPDIIAQTFIQYFLGSYADGKSLFNSVRYASMKLVELTYSNETENQIPGLNWLPIICKNTVYEPPTWQDLGGLTGKLPDSPYKGLLAFTEEDSQYYFGREKFELQLLETVKNKPLVPVIGDSGSGKSSVVFAGLVPQLRNIGNVEILSFRPGSNPFDALAVALRNQTSPVLSDTLDLLRRGTGEGMRKGNRLEELELEINLKSEKQALCSFIEEKAKQKNNNNAPLN